MKFFAKVIGVSTLLKEYRFHFSKAYVEEPVFNYFNHHHAIGIDSQWMDECHDSVLDQCIILETEERSNFQVYHKIKPIYLLFEIDDDLTIEKVSRAPKGFRDLLKPIELGDHQPYYFECC